MKTFQLCVFSSLALLSLLSLPASAEYYASGWKQTSDDFSIHGTGNVTSGFDTPYNEANSTTGNNNGAMDKTIYSQTWRARYGNEPPSSVTETAIVSVRAGSSGTASANIAGLVTTSKTVFSGTAGKTDHTIQSLVNNFVWTEIVTLTVQSVQDATSDDSVSTI